MGTKRGDLAFRTAKVACLCVRRDIPGGEYLKEKHGGGCCNALIGSFGHLLYWESVKIRGHWKLPGADIRILRKRDETMENDNYTVRTYAKLWKHEKVMYAIQNAKLPLPVPLHMALYFGICFFIMFLFGKCIPAMAEVPVIIKYLILPYAGAKFLNTVKLDGKMPVWFVAGIMRFWLMEYGSYMERFRFYQIKTRPIRINWYTGKDGEKHVRIVIRWIAGHGREVCYVPGTMSDQFL